MIYHAEFLSNDQIDGSCSGRTLSALFRNEAAFGERSRVGRREERSVPQTGRL